jgi:acetyl esterase
MRRTPILLALATLILAIPPAGAQKQQDKGRETPGPTITASGIEIQENLIYARPEGVRLELDAYLPTGEGPFPGVLVIPGGAWEQGSSDIPSVQDLAVSLAESGFAAFGVSYRPTRQATYPAAVEDVQEAVAWVRTNASELGVDPALIGAIGHSAGGHLAAMLAVLGEGPLDQGSRIATAVSMSGPMDLEALLESSDRQLVEVVQAFLGCGPGESCTEIARQASPITHADASDPPMKLFNSTDEVIPADQASDMAAALETAGVEHELVLIPGSRHGYLTVNQPLTPEGTVMESVLAFLGEKLVEGGPPGVSPSPEPQPTRPPQEPAEPVVQRGGLVRLVFLLVGLLAIGAAGTIIGVSMARRRRDRREIAEIYAEHDREAPRGAGPHQMREETRRGDQG